MGVRESRACWRETVGSSSRMSTSASRPRVMGECVTGWAAVVLVSRCLTLRTARGGLAVGGGPWGGVGRRGVGISGAARGMMGLL